LKVYTGVSRAAYFGIAEEAKKGNFAFVGHVPLEVDVAEASNAGQRSVEHLMEFFSTPLHKVTSCLLTSGRV